MECRNVDGVGSVYVKDGKFIVEKYPTSLSKILKKGNNFLSHLDNPNSKGYTLVHLRAASHGKNAHRNTHPFIIKDHAYIHNGIWMDYDVAQLALTNYWKPKGETDSEVAAKTISEVGMKKFWQSVNRAGVFIQLNRKGGIQIAKTSGDLMVFNRKNRTAVIASEFPKNYKSAFETKNGFFEFNANGNFVSQLVEEDAPVSFGTGFAQSHYTPYSSNVTPYIPHVPTRFQRTNEEENSHSEFDYRGHYHLPYEHQNENWD